MPLELCFVFALSAGYPTEDLLYFNLRGKIVAKTEEKEDIIYADIGKYVYDLLLIQTIY